MMLSRELKVARAAATAGSKVLQGYYGKKLSYTFKHGLNGQIVSVADHMAEKAILAVIRRAFPKDNVFSEESGRLKRQGQRWWLVDPLDGSRDFLHGIPLWGTMVGLWQDGTMKLGLVQLPCIQEEFWAIHGQGTYLGKQRLQVSKVKELYRSFGTAGGSSSASEALVKITAGLWDKTKSRNLGSASFEYSKMAQGALDYVVSIRPEIYDAAIGAFLVEEAGGKVTDLEGGPWQTIFGINKQSDIMVASNGHLHDQLLQLVRKQLKK